MLPPPPIKTPHSASTGSQRITSKIGSGFALAPVHPLDDELDQLENDQGVTPYDNYEEFGDALWDMMGNGYDCADINRENINFDPQLECMEALAEERGEEDQIYFYHPDHLGSSSFITDAGGDAHQHLQYLPFGESFISQRINYSTRYTFSAKEKDKNTGYHYFGARYYDSENSVWLSVDPMSDKYPDYTPYAYVYNNPINLVDPIGLDSIFYNQKGKEINRIECDDDFFFVKHKDGNKIINGKNYYQGNSKASFFGDRSDKKEGEETIFKEVDNQTINNDEEVVKIVDEHTGKDSKRKVLENSGNNNKYDYKEKVLNQTGFKGGNKKIVYMYNGILYNRNEAGNILWGATVSKVGLPYQFAKFGAQIFTLLKEGKFDEKAERRAIEKGYGIYKSHEMINKW